jgi:hypothetical protein
MTTLTYEQKERIYNFAKRLLVEACPQTQETPLIDSLLAFQDHVKEMGPMYDSTHISSEMSSHYYELDADKVEDLVTLLGVGLGVGA